MITAEVSRHHVADAFPVFRLPCQVTPLLRVSREECGLAFFCLRSHALAFFRFIKVALDPGTHTVSPKTSNPFTISPISQRREETAAVVYCHLGSLRFE